MNRALKILLAALTVAGAARAQTSITLSPNVIHGNIGFANQDPQVLSVLPTLNFNDYLIEIGSTNPPGYSGSNNSLYQGVIMGLAVDSTPYTISAEGNGGNGSVTYNVSLDVYYDGQSSFYQYEGKSVTLFPPDVEPTGAELDFSEIVTLHHIKFSNTAGCPAGSLVPVAGAQIASSNGNYLNAAGTDFYYLAPNWSDQGPNEPTTSSTLYIYLGTDEFIDLIKYSQPINLDPAGDQVVEHCIIIPQGSGSSPLGAITTPVSVTGHTTISTIGGQNNYGTAQGPDTNYRLADYTSGQDISFINLIDGDWVPYLYLRVDPGPTESLLVPASNWGNVAGVAPITIANADITDGLQSFNDIPEEPFVMDPAYFQGDLLFHDEYVHLHPGAASSLSALWYTQDFEANGTSVYGASAGTIVYAGSYLGESGAAAFTTFPGRYDPSSGDLAATYSLPIPLVYNQPEQWYSIPYVVLYFDSVANGYYGGDAINNQEWAVPSDLAADPNPASFRLGELTFSPPYADPGIDISSEQSIDFSGHYCFNEVVVGLQSTTGKFVNPEIQVSGGYTGADFESKQVSYTASGWFLGLPHVGIYVSDPNAFLSGRTSEGSVSFALPQGSWTLTPVADFVDDNGAAGASNFSEVTTLSLGCGQHVALVPGLSVLLDQPAACTEPTGSLDLVPLSGTINSGGAPVDRVWYTLNGGAEIDICNIANNIPCGQTFNVNATLAQGANSISVFASSGFINGIPESDESISCDANGCGTSCTTPPPTCTPVSFAPVDSEYGSVMFEDLWPTNGDLDFNDQNLAYNYEFLLDANNNVIGLQATFNMLSIGATISNGLYLHLPVGIGAAGVAYLATGPGNEVQISPLASLGDAAALGEVVYQLADNTRSLFGGAPGYINTELNQPTLASTPVTLSIRFGAALPQSTFDTANAPFDIFIARTATKNHQVHLPAYDGTATGASHSLFNSGDDGSNTDETPTGGANNAGRWYVNHDGLPFGFVIPQLTVWPKEQTSIQTLFPEISEFASSAGASDPGFYIDQIIAGASWQQNIANSTQLAAPAAVDQMAFPGVTACAQDNIQPRP